MTIASSCEMTCPSPAELCLRRRVLGRAFAFWSGVGAHASMFHHSSHLLHVLSRDFALVMIRIYMIKGSLDERRVAHG